MHHPEESQEQNPHLHANWSICVTQLLNAWELRNGQLYNNVSQETTK